MPPALRVITAKHTLNNVKGTASFIEIVVKWWKIVNVRTACKGTRLNDQFKEPMFSMDDPKIVFSLQLFELARRMEGKDQRL